MPKKFILKNPAFGNVAAQNIEMNVPEEGEYFRTGETSPIQQIKNGQIVSIKPEDILGTQQVRSAQGVMETLPNWGPAANTGGEWQNYYNAVASKLGVNYSNLPYYNPGDISQAYKNPQVSIAGTNIPTGMQPQGTGWYDPASGRETPVGVGIPAPTNTQTQNTGGFVVGKAYKNPNNPEIFQYGEDGQMHWIEDEKAFKNLYGGLPQEGLNYTTLSSTQGLKFGDTLKKPAEAIDTGIIDGNLLNGKEIKLDGTQSTGTTTPTSSTTAIGQGTAKSIADYIKLLTPPETATSKTAGDLSTQISQLLGETTGQSAMLASEQQKAGVNTYTENLKNIQNEISIKTAALEKRLAEISATPMTQMRQSGAEASARRIAQADITFLSAQANAMMNNISYAKQLAQDAVDLKYNPILEQLKVKQAQLELIQPELSKQEKTYSNALSLFLADQEKIVTEQKNNETQINNVLLKAIENKITDQNVLSQIKNAKNYAEAIQIMGQNMPKETPKTSAIYTEWQDYVKTGGKLSFNDYMTMDANRKRSVSTTNIITPETYDKTKTILENTMGKDGFVNTDEYKKQRNLAKDKTSFDKNYSYMLNPKDPTAKDFFTQAELGPDKRYTAMTIPQDIANDLNSDIKGGASLDQLYTAYPDVSPALVQSYYYNQ